MRVELFFSSENNALEYSGDLVAVREVLAEEHSIFLLEGIGVVREVVGTGLMGFLVDL